MAKWFRNFFSQGDIVTLPTRSSGIALTKQSVESLKNYTAKLQRSLENQKDPETGQALALGEGVQKTVDALQDLHAAMHAQLTNTFLDRTAVIDDHEIKEKAEALFQVMKENPPAIDPKEYDSKNIDISEVDHFLRLSDEQAQHWEDVHKRLRHIVPEDMLEKPDKKIESNPKKVLQAPPPNGQQYPEGHDAGEDECPILTEWAEQYGEQKAQPDVDEPIIYSFEKLADKHRKL